MPNSPCYSGFYLCQSEKLVRIQQGLAVIARRKCSLFGVTLGKASALFSTLDIASHLLKIFFLNFLTTYISEMLSCNTTEALSQSGAVPKPL